MTADAAVSLDAARAFDEGDAIAGAGDAFVVLDDELCYLDGNSLGRLPKRTVDRLEHVVATEWGGDLVRGWHEWVEWPVRVGDRLGRAVLGSVPGQVLVCDSTTVNLYRLASATITSQPERRVVVFSENDFPTDRYVLQGLTSEHGCTIRTVDALSIDAIRQACSPGDVALVCASHVDFRTADIAPVAAITDVAHAAGALVLWDLSHSAGAISISLDEAGVDLAAGCSYKYLFGGPGAPAWLYVRREHQEKLQPPIWGWFGQRDQFAMGKDFERQPGIGGWMTGTPNVLGLAAVEEGVAVVEQYGVDAIEGKGRALTAFSVDLFDAWLAPLGFELVTSRDAARRGNHVAIAHPEGRRLARALTERCGVVVDFRPPDVVRFGFSPLTTRFTEVWKGMDQLRRAYLDKLYETIGAAASRVT